MSLKTPKNYQLLSENKPGDRLTIILNHIGFYEKRGRMVALKNLLQEKDPEMFKDLPLNTVYGWFGEYAPSMKRLERIVDILAEDYEFDVCLTQTKTWWKIGGISPFSGSGEADIQLKAGERAREKILRDEKQKGKFDLQGSKLTDHIILLLSEEKKRNPDLTSQELEEIRQVTYKFVNDFINPEIKECPEKYLKLIIKGSFVK